MERMMKGTMKKFLALALALAVTLLSGAVAYAVTVEFKGFAVYGFSLDIPDDWIVTEDKGSETVFIASPDESESVTFVYAHREGKDGPSFARTTADDLAGSDPVETDGGDFEFTFTEGSAQVNVRTRHVGNLGVVMKTEDGGSFDFILSMLDSLIHD